MSDARLKWGVKTYICATPAAPGSLDQSGYEALTWVEIEDVVSCQEFAVKEEIETKQLESGYVRKAKGPGVANDPRLEILPHFTSGSRSTGQAALIAAGLTDFSYPVKRVQDDKLAAAGNGGTQYAIGVITRVSKMTGEDWNSEECMIGIEGDVLSVAPTAS